MFPLEKKEIVHSEMVTDMPAEGDTSTFHIANTLFNHGLSLKQVSGKYIYWGEGGSYHLLKEKYDKLIANIRLTYLKGNIMSHFVA